MSLVALVTGYRMEGDAEGERHVPFAQRWIDAGSEDALSGRLASAVEPLVDHPGGMAEVTMVANGRELLWIREMAWLREPAEAAIRAIHGAAEALSSPDLEFRPEAAQFARNASPGKPLRVRYENPPTVSVVAVPTSRGLLMVRRGLSSGYGKLALPGGHQSPGETWQEAGAREVLEETGARIDPALVRLTDAVTVPSGHNLIFGTYGEPLGDFEPRCDHETLEALFVTGPVDTAFPAHTQAVRRYFEAAKAAEGSGELPRS